MKTDKGGAGGIRKREVPDCLSYPGFYLLEQ